MIKINNDFGTITITKSVISRIVSESVESFGKEVFLTNKKGKRLKLKNAGGYIDHSSEMEITLTDKGLCIGFYILLRFGMSISAVTNKIFDTVSYEVMAATGMEPYEMTIRVTGMYTKDPKTISKRDVEVKR